MSQLPSPTELLTVLEQTEAALSSGDTEAADRTMSAAAELCRRMQAAGTSIPAADLQLMQGLAEQCGRSLMRLERALNAESQRDEKHRRGLMTYQASQRR